ncbi:MAG: energy-coupling factor transporter ATPase [Clostridia bacterium]|nr:energy-coupling factor transporter ATPase [Clostridia bacterium]
MIRAENVSFKYMRNEEMNHVLKDFNIHVLDGEFVVIMGHNGSGKSTFAKLTNAILLPESGDIYVADMNTKNDENLWAIREKAGMIFQNPDNQIVATMVEEDVAFGPENLGVDPEEIRKRVDRVLKIVNMDGYQTRPPHMLSGGQKQRIAIAGILAMSPDCIILDEPTAMLDPSGRIEVLDIIHRLNQDENMTVVLITHFMNEAIHADRVIVLDDGHIKLTGAPKEVFSKINEMQAIGLDVPEVTKLAAYLKSEGIDIPSNIITLEEMISELCRLK